MIHVDIADRLKALRSRPPVRCFKWNGNRARTFVETRAKVVERRGKVAKLKTNNNALRAKLQEQRGAFKRSLVGWFRKS